MAATPHRPLDGNLGGPLTAAREGEVVICSGWGSNPHEVALRGF